MDGYIVGELYFLRCLEENVKMFMQVLKDFVLFLLELQVKYLRMSGVYSMELK